MLGLLAHLIQCAPLTGVHRGQYVAGYLQCILYTVGPKHSTGSTTHRHTHMQTWYTYIIYTIIEIIYAQYIRHTSIHVQIQLTCLHLIGYNKLFDCTVATYVCPAGKVQQNIYVCGADIAGQGGINAHGYDTTYVAGPIPDGGSQLQCLALGLQSTTAQCVTACNIVVWYPVLCGTT